MYCPHSPDKKARFREFKPAIFPNHSVKEYQFTHTEE